jgi:hypothetical protein
VTKLLTFTKAHDLSQLHDELLTAIPALAGVYESGQPNLRVESTGNEIRLFVPDNADEGQISTVVTAHDPANLSASEQLVAEMTTARNDLANQYSAAMTVLDNIVTNGASWTNVQVRDAVIDEARILRRTLRYLKAEMY